MGSGPLGCKESHTTEVTEQKQQHILKSIFLISLILSQTYFEAAALRRATGGCLRPPEV